MNRFKGDICKGMLTFNITSYVDYIRLNHCT